MGIGVLGGGRGSTFANGPSDVPLQMGTLSKAIGAYGGYLCASHAVIDLMRTRARTFIYSTGLPPPVIAAAIAALDLIAREPAYAAEPLRKARLFTRALNLPEAQSAIVPVDRRRERTRRSRHPNCCATKAFWWSRSGRRLCRPVPRGCVSPSPRNIPMPRLNGSPMWCAGSGRSMWIAMLQRR